MFDCYKLVFANFGVLGEISLVWVVLHFGFVVLGWFLGVWLWYLVILVLSFVI